MKHSRTTLADSLRNQIQATLPGGSYIYRVLSEDESLAGIVQTNLGTQDEIQTSYYVGKILADTRNYLLSPSQSLFVGQIIMIPKRVA